MLNDETLLVGWQNYNLPLNVVSYTETLPIDTIKLRKFDFY